MRIPVALPHHQHLVLSVLQTLAVVVGVQWYLIVLICTFVIIYDVEHIFICLFANCVSYLFQCAILRFELARLLLSYFSSVTMINWGESSENHEKFIFYFWVSWVSYLNLKNRQENEAATLENNLAFPQNDNYRVIIWPRNSASGYIPKTNVNMTT